MPFKKIDVNKEIEKKKVSSDSFDKLWTDSREEYRLIGEMIQLRKQQHMSQTELANKIGSKQQIISRIEKKESIPTLHFFCKLLNALGYKLKIEKK